MIASLKEGGWSCLWWLCVMYCVLLLMHDAWMLLAACRLPGLNAGCACRVLLIDPAYDPMGSLLMTQDIPSPDVVRWREERRTEEQTHHRMDGRTAFSQRGAAQACGMEDRQRGAIQCSAANIHRPDRQWRTPAADRCRATTHTPAQQQQQQQQQVLLTHYSTICKRRKKRLGVLL